MDLNKPDTENDAPRSGEHDTLDARGLICPEPVMLLHNRMREMVVGQKLRVLATDPSTQRDFARFCEFLPHQMLEEKQEGEEFIYLIQKGEKSGGS